MNFVAAVLFVLSGLFYAADHNEIGALGDHMCRYGSTFCESPVYVLAGSIEQPCRHGQDCGHEIHQTSPCQTVHDDAGPGLLRA